MVLWVGVGRIWFCVLGVLVGLFVLCGSGGRPLVVGLGGGCWVGLCGLLRWRVLRCSGCVWCRWGRVGGWFGGWWASWVGVVWCASLVTWWVGVSIGGVSGCWVGGLWCWWFVSLVAMRVEGWGGGSVGRRQPCGRVGGVARPIQRTPKAGESVALRSVGGGRGGRLAVQA